MMSSSPPPAHPDGPVDDARWLFPQERAPSPLNKALNLLLERREARLASAFADLEAILNARFDAFKATFDAFEAKRDARLGTFEAKVTTTFAKVDAELGAPHLLARTGIAPSVHIPSSTTMWMSSPTAAGSTLRIEEVCTRHGVPLAAAALQFPLAHPAIAAIIPGAVSKEEMLGNFALLRHPIPAALWEELRQLRLLDPRAPVPT